MAIPDEDKYQYKAGDRRIDGEGIIIAKPSKWIEFSFTVNDAGDPSEFVAPEKEVLLAANCPSIDDFQSKVVLSIQKALQGGGSEEADRYIGDIIKGIGNSPYFPSFYGIRWFGYVGVDKTKEIKGIGKFNFSIKANVSPDGRVWGSINVGPQIGDGKVGVICNFYLSKKNDEIVIEKTYSIGMDRRINENLKLLFRNMDPTDVEELKNWELGVQIGSIVGIEIRWKPYIFITNFQKLINEKK